MDPSIEGLLGQGLTSEVVGLLILNELKCFRKELTNEVKSLSRKLDSLSEIYPLKSKGLWNSNYSDISVGAGSSTASSCFNSIFKNFNTNSSVFSQSETFREISPQRHSDIRNNHIAFRMDESDNQNNDPTAFEIVENNVTAMIDNRNEKKDSQNNLSVTSVNSLSKLNQTRKFSNQNPNLKQANDSNNTKSKYTTLHKCTVCTEEFNSLSLYKEHYSDKHAIDFSSSFASKSFLDDQTNKNVFDIPHSKVVYICSVCSRHFSSKGGVLRHSNLHSGIKKYVCKLCGKGFFRSDHLKSHLPTHSRRKQYQCSVCSKYFSGFDNFRNHMQLHKVEDSQTDMIDQHGAASELTDVHSTSSFYNSNMQDASVEISGPSIDNENDYYVKQEVTSDSN